MNTQELEWEELLECRTSFMKGWRTAEELRPITELSKGDKVVHTYAAKLQTATSRGEEWAYEFRCFGEPGRGRFKATVWDGDGLVPESCTVAEVDLSEIATKYQDYVICPHCGAKNWPDEEYELFSQGDDREGIECGHCGETFNATRHVSCVYSTEKPK